MELIAPPGVYRPQNDTWMLAEAVATAGVRDADVLDVGTGTGALAIAALQSGARSATGLDVSAKAIAAAWLNARRHRVPLRVRRGDIRNLRNQQYNVVLSNPPYVPSMLAQASGAARAWDAGVDGREILDPLCSSVNRLLRPQGFLLLVQSVLSHPEVSVRMLREAGLDADIVERRTLPFGPVLRGRAKWLERRDLIEPGQRSEELVVIRAQR
ncbi:HemK2/MTQ2 family protein methyltransferase [Thermocrispum municipale]|uniref:HemK2/MTQ2 family protein methyltransferase n=1 Tax=Thermocrispum municipale TaxID=37926 RepID=UPI000416A7DC|nr:HemK2/MTQ2 family protein methyltransferase [Thermocrispum municipale]